MLNTCIQVHANQARKEAEKAREFNNPLTSYFAWWLIIAEHEVKERSTTNPSALFGSRSEVIRNEPRLVGYGELLAEYNNEADLVFHGKLAGENGAYIQTIGPKLAIKNNTVHLTTANGEEIPLWPAVQINGGTRHDERYFFTYGGMPLFVGGSNGHENTTVANREGRTLPMLELASGETADLGEYNVRLGSLGWDYSVKLEYLIRVSRNTHVAIAEGRPYVLKRPCHPAEYMAKYGR